VYYTRNIAEAAKEDPQNISSLFIFYKFEHCAFEKLVEYCK
jgi:hypothetical protein